MPDFLNYVNVLEADGLFFVIDRYKKQIELFGVPAYNTKKEAEELCKLLNDTFETGVDYMR